MSRTVVHTPANVVETIPELPIDSAGHVASLLGVRDVVNGFRVSIEPDGTFMPHGGSLQYAQIATTVAFTGVSVAIDGAIGTTATDVAFVYDQHGALMVPQPSGTMSYASSSTSVATVDSSGVVTSVFDGTSTLTATFTPS